MGDSSLWVLRNRWGMQMRGRLGWTRLMLGVAAVLVLTGCQAPALVGSSPVAGSVEPPVDAADPPVDASAAVEVAEALLSGTYEEVTSQFNAEMAEAVSAQELADVTESALADFGPVVDIGDPGSVVHDGGLVFMVPVSFSEAFAHVRVTYDGDGEIAGLYLLR